MQRALIVGIDDYERAPLRGCVRDANAVATVLETHGTGSPNSQVRSTTSPSKEVTRVKLREAIDRLFATDCDVALRPPLRRSRPHPERGQVHRYEGRHQL